MYQAVFMKVSISCVDCMGPGPVTAETTYSVPVNNSCVYELTCRFGHETVVIIPNSRFEVIFESGISALKDGYFREAVFNFAVALERFYEYTIVYVLRNKIIDPGNHIIEAGLAHYQALWATMSKHSERQLGAFYSLYVNEFEEVPPVFSKKWLVDNTGLQLTLNGKAVETTEFRNKVVHQGHIPTKEEAILYGECTNKYIHYLLNKYLAKNGSYSLIEAMNVERRLEMERVLGPMILHYRNGRKTLGLRLATFMASIEESYLSRPASLYEVFPND
jgi:hypothetical protein